jgi:type III pantothenate kinase
MLITADIGNSGIRLGAWDSQSQGEPALWRATIRGLDQFGELDGRIGLRAARWLVSSVHAPRLAALCGWLESTRPADHLRLLTHQDVPLRLAVERPEKTGIDRLVAGWTAWSHQARRKPAPVIVVDAGTAVTVDWISREGVFEGGNIFPGAQASLDWLSQGTDQLPEVDGAGFPDLPFGRNTVDAMLSGVFRSQAGGVCRLVENLREMAGQPDVPVWMTGGGITAIRSLLPSDWIHSPELVLRGLHELAANLS